MVPSVSRIRVGTVPTSLFIRYVDLQKRSRPENYSNTYTESLQSNNMHRDVFYLVKFVGVISVKETETKRKIGVS